MKDWVIGDIHPQFGKVAAMGIRDGDPWRMFIKDGSVSLMPLDVLKYHDKKKLKEVEEKQKCKTQHEKN